MGAAHGCFIYLTKLHLKVCARMLYLSHKVAPEGVTKPAYAGSIELRVVSR